MTQDAIILIPARMASTRLPGKPLADIHGKAMILHVLDRAHEAQVGDIYIACAEQEIADAVEGAGGNAIITDPEHPCGTDRIYEALQKVDADKTIQYVINVQGDLPTLDPKLIQAAVKLLENKDVDIATLAVTITDEAEKTNPNVVKCVMAVNDDKMAGRALYFTRATAPWGEGELYHHIGLYAYRREALEKFVTLPPSPLEQREKLEQLRALENNMRIDVAIVDTAPLGVDTQEDLDKARAILAPK